MNLHRPPHYLFGLPAGARFFFEEPTDANPGAGTSNAADLSLFEPTVGDDGKPPIGAPASERVEGEKLPDFGKLGAKKGAEKPAEPSGGDKTPPTSSKAATAKPDAKAGATKEAAKPAETPEKPPEAAKPDAKAAAKPAEPVKGPKPGEKAAPKAEEKKELPEIPADDKDLDALQPKPGAPQNVIKSFNDIKAIAKAQREAARTYKAQLESIQTEAEELKKNVGAIPKEVEEELTGLRNLSLVLQAENDPNFKREWDGRVEAADKKAYDWLAGRGLSQEWIDKIKAVGGIHKSDLVTKLHAKLSTDPRAQKQLLDLVDAREGVDNERSEAIKKLTESKDKFQEAVAKRDEEARTEFSKKIEQASIPLAAANDWILEKDIPADATEEQRKVLEAENATVKKYSETFGENVRASYGREAERIAEIALNAVKAEYLEEQNKELATERDKLAARVAALESRISKTTAAGRLAHVDTPPADTKHAAKTTVEEGKVGGDGASAIKNFFASRT